LYFDEDEERAGVQLCPAQVHQGKLSKPEMTLTILSERSARQYLFLMKVNSEML
jgi:hypothetical protein